MSYSHRYIARIQLEAQTPLFVGSGESSLLVDSIVQKDHFGLPIIQGSSLAGVLRHALLDRYDFDKEFDQFKEEVLNLWGTQFYGDSKENFDKFKLSKGVKKDDITKGFGSRIKISSAKFLVNENKVIEQFDDLNGPEIENILVRFENLPTRQHVRITDKGVADSKNNGLFNNEIVYAGARFLFEIELIGTKNDKNSWDELLETIHSPQFRIGQGTRKGYGDFKVSSIKTRIYDLNKEADFDDYLAFDVSYNAKNEGFNGFKSENSTKLTSYQLVLKPDRFFIFSEGSGDEEVDNKPLMEDKIVYEDGKIKFKKFTVIPASSIKGAIAHRTAFHFNKKMKRWAGKGEATTYEDNEAVIALFGKKAGIEEKQEKGKRGNVLMNDFYYSDEVDSNSKIFNHVAIDRFTGGASDSALFSEKVSYFIKENQTFELIIDIIDDEIDLISLQSLEKSLEDICKGLLPLGGMTTKGHGIFTGKLNKNGNEIFRYGN
jgi:CRISPR/Cas system CSM-associated protein Csm3 (group 7 of RAMP superfamily)